jgi:transcriptional regulator with PAS, ATPase and Fis domain
MQFCALSEAKGMIINMDNSNLWFNLFDNVDIGIHIINNVGDIIYCNVAFLKMTNTDREEVLKSNVFQMIADGLVKRSVAATSLKEKRKVSMINHVTTQRGFNYRQLATAKPIFDSFGEIQYVIHEMIRLDILETRFQEAIIEEKNNIRVHRFKPTTSFIGESDEMKRVIENAHQFAQVDSPVVITGETGVGKEVMAHYIHQNSRRSQYPLVVINCAAVPENLIETELFGYVKGAFTGAVNTGKMGLIEQAEGGVLFLDEINSMPLPLQGKLLRVLETHKIKKIGSAQERFIDFRVIAATNADLIECVKKGTFRADLYYRLSVIVLDIPPLRERKKDIIPLTIFFLNSLCRKYGMTKVFSSNVFRQLEDYPWPGNVRELKNVVERILITSSPKILEIQQIPRNILYEDYLEKEQLNRKSLKLENNVCELGELSLKEHLELYEREFLARVLQQSGSTYKAAKLLKVNQSTIARKKMKYNL